MRVKPLAPPVDAEPPRSGEDSGDCVACNTADEAYIWVTERWRVRAMDRPTGLPAVLVLECRSHFDLGDLPNLLAAELGVMTVRLERAIRSLDGVARVHVNRWGDGSAHLHMWFLARPYGRLQLRGTFLSLWDDILPPIPEYQWQQNLGQVAALLAEFGGRAVAEPPHIAWQSPATVGEQSRAEPDSRPQDRAEAEAASPTPGPADVESPRTAPRAAADSDGAAVTRDLSESTRRLPPLRAGIPGEGATVRLRPADADPAPTEAVTVRLRPTDAGQPATVRPRPAGDDAVHPEARPPAHPDRDARPPAHPDRPPTDGDPAVEAAGSPG